MARRSTPRNRDTLARMGRRSTALVAAGCFVAFGTVHCGARTDFVMTLPEDQYVDKLVVGRCALFDECCRDAGYASSDSDCSSRARAQIAGLVSTAKSVGAKYDPVAGAACVATLGVRCAALESLKTLHDVGGPCDRVYFGGPTALGGPCDSVWECQGNETGTVSCFFAGGVTRTCGPIELDLTPPPCGAQAPKSGGCSEELPVCRDGRCVRPVLGEPCNGNHGDFCAPSTVCDRLNTRTCIVPPKAPGESCASHEQCEGYRCENGRCLSPGSLAGDSLCAR
jgi:hypothetical protein